MLAAVDAPAASLRAKAAGEAAIRVTGVPATILRPTYFMETLPRHVKGTRATMIGRQPHPLHLLAADDFAAMVSSALSSEGLVGEAVAARGPEGITLADALRRYCAARRADVTVVTRPLWLMSVLDRTVLRGQLEDTIKLMRRAPGQWGGRHAVIRPPAAPARHHPAAVVRCAAGLTPGRRPAGCASVSTVTPLVHQPSRAEDLTNAETPKSPTLVIDGSEWTRLVAGAH